MVDFPGSVLYRHPKTYLSLVSAFYAVGLAGHLIIELRPLMLVLTPWFLLLSGAFLVWPSLAIGKRIFRLWFVAAWLLTFALESIGVASGAIFGTYHYGLVLGWLVLGVPPVIGFNWVLVVLGAMALAQRVPVHPLIRIFLVGLIATLFDLVMEPSAFANGYWSWADGIIPFQNYLAWFLIATIMAASAWRLTGQSDSEIRTKDPPLICSLIAQVAFFLIQDIALWSQAVSL